MWFSFVESEIYEQMNNNRIFLCFTGSQCNAKKVPSKVSNITSAPHSWSIVFWVESMNKMHHGSLCPNNNFFKSTYFAELCAHLLSFIPEGRLIWGSLLKFYFPDIYFNLFTFLQIIYFLDLHHINLSSHCS